MTSVGGRARFPQLDGLRGIAVILVIFHHWTSWGHAANLGNIGVQAFFVISGFLITGILCGEREKVASGLVAFADSFKSFQLSRIARIWPIYFLTLAAVAIAGNRFEQLDALPMHMIFASNVLFMLRGDFGTTLAHFWTLSVEQQFYLVWPLAVTMLNRRALEWLTYVLIVLAPLSRVVMFAVGYVHFASFNTLPFANMDSLGMGALLAQWDSLDSASSAMRKYWLSRAAVAAAVAFVIIRFIGSPAANLEQSLYAVSFAWIVMRARTGFGGIIGQVLEFRPLLLIGLVSYGIYVYHMFVPRILGFVMRAVDASLWMQNGIIFFVLCAIATGALATVSWVVVERPIVIWRKSVRTPEAVEPYDASAAR